MALRVLSISSAPELARMGYVTVPLGKTRMFFGVNDVDIIQPTRPQRA